MQMTVHRPAIFYIQYIQICNAGHATNKAASLYTHLVLAADMSCSAQLL